MTATIGLVQLDYITPVVERHIANGQFFDHALQDIAGLSLCKWDTQAEPSYWFYTVLVDEREKFSRHLTTNGIANTQAHKRNDLHSVFSDSRCELPGLDVFYDKMIHIPCGWWVDDAQRQHIVDVIRQGW